MGDFLNKSLGLAMLVIVTVALTSCTTFRTKADNGYYKQRVVYHFNNIETAYRGLRNIDNHLNAVNEKNTEVIAVTHGGGAYMLVNGIQDKSGKTFDSYLAKLANRGVKFQICSNTLRNKKIPKSKISIHATVVPSGAAQLVHLQQKGYIYIKP